jgi:ubiquinone/menaquinone biosynthesis C-methylase UbiE
MRWVCPVTVFRMGAVEVKIVYFSRCQSCGVQKRRNSGPLLAVFCATVVLLCCALGRAAESEIDNLVQILQLKPGSIVADVGAGSGEVSISIAERVGPLGRVYSTEINPELIDKIRSLIQKEGIQNVVPVTGRENDTELSPDCCDGIVLRQVYHHLTDPFAMDRSLYRALRPDARLAIIDFEPSQLPGQPSPPGVPANRGGHGVPKKIVAEELTEAGFVLVKTVDWPISRVIRHYCMLFIKPPPPLPGPVNRNAGQALD